MATAEVKYDYLFLCYCLQVLMQLSCTQSSFIKVDSDGGYTNIVIAIPDRTEQMENVAFQSYFEEASKILYTATNSRLFFKEIHVLIPSSWNVSHDSNSIFETYYDADIRVDKFNPLQKRGDLYTQQPRGCGEGGDFIYLNPSVIDEWEKTKNETKVYQFVQEWAKFRYGIFEETGRNNSLYPDTYQNSSGQFLTECAASENKYSIMADPAKHGKKFCDENHNTFAPNRQNALCNSKSTWSVIIKHADFSTAQIQSEIFKNSNADSTNIAQGLNEKFKPPEIKFVKPFPTKVTFIIDPSLWNKNNKESLVKIFLRKFTQDLPKESTGNVHCIFANGSAPNYVSNTAGQIFVSMEATLNSVDDGKIKLKEAIEFGKGKPFLLNANYLIIISTLKDLIPEDMLPLKEMENINLFLLTFTSKQEILPKSAKKIAEFINNSTRRLWLNIKTDLPEAKCDDSQTLLQTMDAITLFANKFKLNYFYPNLIKIQDYLIEATKLETVVLKTKEASVSFIVYDCNRADITEIFVNGISNHRTAVPGLDSRIIKWKMRISSQETVNFQFDSPQATNLSCSVWLDVGGKDMSESYIIVAKLEKVHKEMFGTTTPVIIYAFNPQNYVLIAELTNEDGSVVTVDLWDNGNGDPDVLAGDNIYSRYFFNKDQEDHLYSVRITAKDDKDNIILQQSLGSVYIESSDITQFPPNRILDFHETGFIENSSIVQFSWTAPGSALDHGSASNYYIKCDSNFVTIETLEAKNVIQQENNKLNMSPLTSGQKESLNWEILSPNTVYFCFIIAENNHKKHSKSNIVSVVLNVQDISSTMSTTYENYNLSTTSTADKSCNCTCTQKCTGEVAGIGVLSALVVILLGIIVYLLRKTKLETILRNPMPKFKPKPPPSRLDITELPIRPRTERQANIYQAKQPSTFKPAEVQTINQEALEEDIYDDVGVLPSSDDLEHGGDDEDVEEQKGVKLPQLPSPK